MWLRCLYILPFIHNFKILILIIIGLFKLIYLFILFYYCEPFMIWTLKILIIKAAKKSSSFLPPSSFTFLPSTLLYDSKPYDLWDIWNVQNILSWFLTASYAAPLRVTSQWRRARRAWSTCEMSGWNGARRGILNNRLLLSSYYLETLLPVIVSGKHRSVSVLSEIRHTWTNKKLSPKESV